MSERDLHGEPQESARGSLCGPAPGRYSSWPPLRDGRLGEVGKA